jgi:hypothetical protein
VEWPWAWILDFFFFTIIIRDIRKFIKLLLLALSFGKTPVEKNGGTSKYRTQGQTLECTKTQVETVSELL